MSIPFFRLFFHLVFLHFFRRQLQPLNIATQYCIDRQVRFVYTLQMKLETNSLEYWKNKYAQILKNKGFDITFEKPIGEGKTVDVVATKNDKQIAIEVETGRSDILSNINKCLQAKFDKIIVVAVNERIESKVKPLLEANDLHQNPKIIVSCARRMI